MAVQNVKIASFLHFEMTFYQICTFVKDNDSMKFSHLKLNDLQIQVKTVTLKF